MMIISDHSVQPLVFQSYRKLKNKSIAQTQEQNLFIGFVRISCFYICVLYYTGALNHTLEQALTPGVSTISKKKFDWYLRLEFFYKLVQSSFFLFYKITKNRDPLKGKLGEKILSAQSFYLTLTKRSFNRQF